MDAADEIRETWWLANRYPEVCRAHAEFGGSDQLEDWLRRYHAAVLAERIPLSRGESPNATNL